MNPSFRIPPGGNGAFQVLWADGERVFCRRKSHGGDTALVLAVLTAIERPAPAVLDRFAHEYELREELDAEWAARPLEFVREQGQAMLLLQDPGGEPLDRLIGPPMGLEVFLRLAVALSVALGRLHGRGLVHKDIKPTNILVSASADQVWLTGFGIASRLPRERQSPTPPEVVEGTLAYMAPEQTGWMNRSLDSRGDLYSLGVTLYQMLTGSLPFTAVDPMEWVHCHIARTPVPPAERLENIPAPVSEIIMKLLAKTVEERYQTAVGAEHDFRRCLTDWKAEGFIDDFPLGQQDTPDRLLIPEKLYGRDREIATLVAAFDRTVKSGTPELVLVSGYSGIGKSSVINELHKVLVPPRGVFAFGKFDQYKRDIPYSTLAQAFQSLVRPLLSKSDAELANWRDALCKALGPNGQLMVELVPELKLIIGEQPAVADILPADAQRRFQLVSLRFIGVFARPEHPLALFFDDLQWLDAATLDLLEHLLTSPDVQHLLVIGAYRNNEVDVAHPLSRKLQAIRNTGAKIQEIALAPLDCEHLGQLLAEALHGEPGRVAPLAQLVHEKTGGNPFFTIQFIWALAEEGLLRFDHDAACWSWNLERIRAEDYTDNVVELMVGKLARLPRETQAALRQLACVGNTAEVTMLSIAFGTSEAQAHADLREAVRLELVELQEGAYTFAHDRVQEAAYSLIPEASRAEVHLRIGRLLAAQTPLEKREEMIFEIVNQLNRGAALITAQEEREQLAEFNLVAGKRAKASSAYASALTYLVAGAAMLLEGTWERRQDIAFALELHLADCERCTGALPSAEERLAALATRAADTPQRAAVAVRRVDLYTMLGAFDRAVGVGLEYLRHVGIDWSAHPSGGEARREYERIWTELGSRAIEDLIGLPLMQDPESLATLDVLTTFGVATWYTDENLYALAHCRAVKLSLERGNSDAAPAHYASVGLIATYHFGHYDTGYRLGKMACDLTERRGWKRFGGKTYVIFMLVIPWTRPVREGIDPARRALQLTNEQGDPSFAAYACRTLISTLLASGDPLDHVEREAEHGFEFARSMRHEYAADMISPPLALVRTLRGETAKFGSLDHGVFTERSFEGRLTGHPAFALPEAFYWVRKLQARFFAGDHASAIEAAKKAESLFSTSTSLSVLLLDRAEYHLYAALSRAACCEPMGPDPYAAHREALAAHDAQLRAWAANCPENFENRVALVGAEIARIEGRELDAERLYEQAINSARANGFVHNEALAYELAARFYAARGLRQFAHLYLRNARYGYLRWGAVGKVRQLDTTYPDLGQEEPLPGPTSTINVQVERLDFATVMKVLQAVASDTGQDNLIDTLMQIAMEQAGAERALLINPCGHEPRIEAEATTNGDVVTVRLADDVVSGRMLPESVLHYVLRTREIVISDDAVAQSPFGVDSYISQRQARSILCLPLLNQAKLIGVLYLENNLAPRVFAPGRVSVLKLLASQAAIALENSRLYRDGRVREAKIRRLVDSNIIGIVIGDFEGRVLEANDEFLRMASYDREDLVSGRIKWSDLTTPDWRDRNNATIERQKRSRRLEPFETEYTKKDGSRVPVLIGAATFEEESSEGVAFVLDLTTLKRAEEKSRESELKLRQIIETVPGFIWSTDSAGEPTHFNQRLLDYSGKRLEDFQHRGWETFVHPADLPETTRALDQAIKTGTSFDSVHRLRRADGEYRWHHGRAEPLRDREGRIVQWYGLSVDIDEGKRAEQALRESEYKLRQIIESVPSHVWSADPAGEPTQFSQSALDYYGVQLENLKHGGSWAYIHPDDYPETARVFYHAIQTGTSFRHVTRLRRADGEFRWHDTRGEPLRDQQGRIVQWYGLSVDIDEARKAEDQLRRSEAYLAEAQRLSHTGTAVYNDSEIFYFSDETLRIFGFDPRYGLPSRDAAAQVIHHDDRERVQELARRALLEKRDYSIACRLLLPDGTVKYIEGVAHPRFSASGELLEVVSTIIDVTERKRSEEAIRESEYKLRQIIETVPTFLWSTEPDGKVSYANQRILDYCGVRLEDFVRDGWGMFLHPDDLPETVRGFSHAIETGTSHEAVHRVRRSDGEYRWYHSRSEPLRDQQGRIVQWYGLTMDIDEAKKADDRLRRSESYLAEAQRLSQTGTAVYSDTTNFYWSDETYRILGVDPRNGLPTREAAVQMIHPDDRGPVLEVARRSLREKKDYRFEVRFVTPTGIKYVEGNAHPKFSASGELIEIVSTILDVTDRKRAEEALQKSEARARSAIDGIAGLIVILAPNGEFETVNRQAFEYFGQSLEWIRNWGTNGALHPEDRPRVFESFKRAIASGTSYHIDLRLRRFDGEYRWFDTRGVPIRDDTGHIARWYILATDIEDRTRALAQLEQMRSDFAHMNRVSMMGELAASLSHEITQPIASARNNARAAQNFLDMQPPDLNEVREALSCVVGDTDRAGDIVDRIRDHIKKAPPRKEHFDLNEAINEIIVLGRSAIVKNGVSVQTQLSEGLFPIHCDRVQLQQVVLNLILNAAEAMGLVEAEPRELLISTEQHHTGVLVAVRDSGPGIDPTHLERVFEAFYTTKSRGVGMGLSICRSIIDAHGGRLWAEANEPRGTIFKFTLPAVQVGP